MVYVIMNHPDGTASRQEFESVQEGTAWCRHTFRNTPPPLVIKLYRRRTFRDDTHEREEPISVWSKG